MPIHQWISYCFVQSRMYVKSNIAWHLRQYYYISYLSFNLCKACNTFESEIDLWCFSCLSQLMPPEKGEFESFCKRVSSFVGEKIFWEVQEITGVCLFSTSWLMILAKLPCINETYPLITFSKVQTSLQFHWPIIINQHSFKAD